MCASLQQGRGLLGLGERKVLLGVARDIPGGQDLNGLTGEGGKRPGTQPHLVQIICDLNVCEILQQMCLKLA